MVSYCLGITALDPLRYDLLFERFLNPERNEMPDMDLDFCAERRGEVIDYVREKYGDDHVSQIITFNTMSAKAVIKDVARAMDIPFQRANEISKLIEEKELKEPWPSRRNSRPCTRTGKRARTSSTPRSSWRAWSARRAGTRPASSYPAALSPTTCPCTGTRTAPFRHSSRKTRWRRRAW